MLFIAESLSYQIGYYTFRLFDYSLNDERTKEVETYIKQKGNGSNFIKKTQLHPSIIIVEKFDLHEIQKIHEANPCTHGEVYFEKGKKKYDSVKFLVWCDEKVEITIQEPPALQIKEITSESVY